MSSLLSLILKLLALLSPTWCSPIKTNESVTVRIIHITDVYTLENFASLKTLITEKWLEPEVGKTLSLLSGDFLMPYLLSTVDSGRGMMNMLNAVPIDYLTWGNHENDLAHHHVMEREREYKGVWINTNMQSHESFENSTCQVDVEVIRVRNGNHFRKIAMLGILTNSRSLLPPGSFNGAVIEDPWETMRRYNDKLKHTVDLVLPICHLYEIQDERTAAEFDFPLILGGHDHHPVDRVINGTRLLKPGADANYARVIDITWASPHSVKPTISSELLSVRNYAPNERIQRMAKSAYHVLRPLRHTQIGFISEEFRPLSSVGARSRRVTVATFLSTTLWDALNVDAFIAKGGNFRGSRQYEDNQQFTLELLQSELGNCHIYIAQLPGSILQVGLRETWTQPGTGWFQHDDGVVVDDEGLVVSVNGEALDPERLYSIATLKDFFRSRDGPSIGRYYESYPDHMPRNGQMQVYPVILDYMARQTWKLLLQILDVDCTHANHADAFAIIDIDQNGYLDRNDVSHILHNIVGFETFPGEFTFVDYFLASAGGLNSTLPEALMHLNGKEQCSAHCVLNLTKPFGSWSPFHVFSKETCSNKAAL